MNLMKKIWMKNLEKACSERDIQKLQEDLGPLKGIFHIKKLDAHNGKLLDESVQTNLLTNLSKSNVIRLIGQGISPWIGSIDPAELRLSRMRFGNATGFTASKLNYYDLTEASTRENNGTHPGGNGLLGSIPGEAAAFAGSPANPQVFLQTAMTPGPAGTLILDFNLPNPRPPSHATLLVEFYDDDPFTVGNKIETLTFANPAYTRGVGGSTPTLITTEGGFNPISTSLPGTDTKLFYDYTEGSAGWKLLLETVPVPEVFSHINLVYEIGKFNIINSVVPKQGSNQGSGTTLLSRYGTNVTQDHYSVAVDSQEFADSPTDFIDDFSVTMNVLMTGLDGNGENIPGGQQVDYSEAFLFNERDDLFSIIELAPTFSKDSDTAYLISWIISAPL